MKLYEMTGAIGKLMDDDELSPETLKDALDSIEDDFQEKGVNIVKLSQSWDSDIDAVDAEIKRLQAKKKALQSRQDSLREYLRYNMEVSGISKIECPLFTITLRKPVKTAQVDDVDSLPDEYVSVKTTVAPDKKSILKALKDGIDIPGAKLSEGKSSLVIK